MFAEQAAYLQARLGAVPEVLEVEADEFKLRVCVSYYMPPFLSLVILEKLNTVLL